MERQPYQRIIAVLPGLASIKQHDTAPAGERSSARVNLGTRTSANILKISFNFGTNQRRYKLSFYMPKLTFQPNLMPESTFRAEITSKPKLLVLKSIAPAS